MTEGKLHWTQRPENKARLRKLGKTGAKKRYSKKRDPYKKKASSTIITNGSGKHHEEEGSQEIAALYGYVQARAEGVAASAGLTVANVTYRLGVLLQCSARGKPVRP